MAPLVAPGIIRYTLYGTIHDRPWNCRLDMDHDTAVAGDRAEDAVLQARIMLNEWIDHIRDNLVAQCILVGCRYLDLNSLDGTAGDVTQAESPRVMPSPGVLTADAASGQVAALITKRVAGGRGRRKGRMFLPGLAEAGTTNNSVHATTLGNLTSDLALFLDGIEQDAGGLFGYQTRLVVVHTVGDTYSSHDNVTALEPQSRLATQRRRLRG